MIIQNPQYWTTCLPNGVTYTIAESLQQSITIHLKIKSTRLLNISKINIVASQDKCDLYTNILSKSYATTEN